MKKKDKPNQKVSMPEASRDTGTHRVLIKPGISEKSYGISALGKYVFRVNKSANKISVRKEVEKVYGVKVADVNMLNVRGKKRVFGRVAGRTSDWKKAIVTLKAGQSIAELNGGGVK